MKQTNLGKIKEVAKLLFDAIEIKPAQYDFIIQHPYTNCKMVLLSRETAGLEEYREALETELVSVCETNKSYADYLKGLLKMSEETFYVDVTIPAGKKFFRNQIFNLIENAKSITDILMLINKPWYMTFLKFAKEFMSSQDLGYLLAECWTEQEFPNRDSNANLKEIIGWFKEADKKTLMTEEEFKFYKRLHNKNIITVYRGISYDGKPKGLSWTINFEKAKWFALRFKNENSKVYKLNIDLSKNSDTILACFLGRNEQEVVVDITKVNNWQEVAI